MRFLSPWFAVKVLVYLYNLKLLDNIVPLTISIGNAIAIDADTSHRYLSGIEDRHGEVLDTRKMTLFFRAEKKVREQKCLGVRRALETVKCNA